MGVGGSKILPFVTMQRKLASTLSARAKGSSASTSRLSQVA